MTNPPKRPRDFSQAAKLVIDIATGERPNRDPAPEEQGRLGHRAARGGELQASWREPGQNGHRDQDDHADGDDDRDSAHKDRARDSRSANGLAGDLLAHGRHRAPQ